MDNRIFKVNGSGEGTLTAALELVFDGRTAEGWRQDKRHGLILYWSTPDDPRCQPFVVPMRPIDLTTTVSQWLSSDFARDVELPDGCGDFNNFDGSISDGWYIYFDDTADDINGFYTLCAIKPAYLWHPK